MPPELEVRFARLVEHHVRHGALPAIEAIVGDRPDLVGPLEALAQRYLDLSTRLATGVQVNTAPRSGVPTHAPPVLEGFRTIERLGAGGMGEVYKLRDLKLDRFVAAKVVRADRRAQTALSDFLREAKSMALFADRHVVQVFEFRSDVDPPVIIMEYVEGFELGRVGPSLEYGQRARIMREVCDVIHHAHELGIQHRDLKPSNIMLDESLSPKILDFGLSAGDPSSGHLQGTPSYLAPEQLDPSQPIDGRTDIYALGVILYELIAGALPYGGRETADLLAAIRRSEPRLPAEVNPRVPEPLQAIALKAMERRPADRYQSAHEMALDLGRYLDGRPVLAHPTQYASTLGTRARAHVEQIEEWLRLRLIYPHEGDRLRTMYRQLDAREDDWIAAGRVLSYSQIALYFGAFLLFAGSLFYFAAHRFFDGAVSGILRPFVVLALPWIGLNVTGWRLYRTERKAVAVAFFLAGVSLLPLFLLIWFHETGTWVVPAETPGQLFTDGSVSNRQLQVTILIACVWSGWLALRTRTAALSTVFTILAFLMTLAILTDFGLRAWLEAEEFDRVALHVWPAALAYGVLGLLAERSHRPWLGRPLYVAGTVVIVLVLDLLALNGRMFDYLDVSLQRFQSPDDPVLLDTLCALTLNGLVFYLLALTLEHIGPELMKIGAGLLFIIAPFSTLEPLAYLVKTQAYKPQLDWLYLGLAASAAVLSHHRQQKSFYYAGIINTGVALFFIADRRDWFDKPLWAMAVIVVGLVILASGFVLDAREKRARR